MGTKTCNKCGKEYPATTEYFNINNGKKDGLNYSCKECMKEYRAKIKARQEPCEFYSIYKHTTPNGKVYIGMTGRKAQERWDNGHGYHSQRFFWSAIQKYKWINIKHEILYDNLTKDEAYKIEIQLIDLYDSTNRNKGYNLSTGGDGGATGTILSDETKKKMSLSRMGEKHPMFGKHHTEKTKNVLREKLTGEKHPQFGTHRSAETKMKLHYSNSGEKHGMFGTHHSAEHKQKISLGSPLQRPVICLETGVIYRSAAEASRQTIANAGHITSCCKGAKMRITAGGFHWKYVKEDENARI